ncbi:MAG TPA: glycoside hydrolase family 27 protein [Jatrophihabitans sp.]
MIARGKFVVIGLLLLAALCGGPTRPQQPATVDLGLALTPPMGWDSYNAYGRRATATDLEAQAAALVASGMKAAGYSYVNLDGGWTLRRRDAHGRLQVNRQKFPHGIAPVVDYVHSLGLKFGIYASLGKTNCAGSGAGSWGHYRQDVRTFARWHVDFVKVDWCAVPRKRFPGLTGAQVAQRVFEQFGRALEAAGRPMAYSLSTNHPGLVAWAWASTVGNMWRTNGDIHATYARMRANFIANAGRYAIAGPGRWNDPDMLEVGNGRLTPTESRTNFSLWAEMAAPLIAGNDLTRMSSTTRRILTNRAVIAVNQDRLGQQGRVVARRGGHWILTKPLASGARAIVLFNDTAKPAVISTSARTVGLPSARRYGVDDLWTHLVTSTAGRIVARVAPHAVAMLKLSPMPDAPGSARPSGRQRPPSDLGLAPASR